MNDFLPEGWVELPFAALLTELRNGISTRPSLEPPGTPILRISAVRAGSVSLDDHRFLPDSAELISTYRLRDCDLLFTRYNGSLDLLGVCGMIRGLGRDVLLYPDKLIRVRVDERVTSPDYIEAYFRSPRVRQAITALAKSSAGQQGISGSNLKRQVLLLPPLAEQRRIVEKVEALLEQVNRARARLDRVPLILERFRQAVLAAACSGGLTDSWRVQHAALATTDTIARRVGARTPPSDQLPELSIPTQWRWATAESLCDVGRPITYGVIKLGPPVVDGIPTLRSSDVRPLFIERDQVKRISRGIADQYSRTYLRGGEVLVTVRGTLGGVATVPADMAGWNISREVAQLPLREGIVPQFVMYAVASTVSQNWLSERAKGATYTGVNIADLRQLPLPLPSWDEQRVIVSRVEALLRIADVVASRVGAASSRIEHLVPAILSKAFAGELVPTEAELARAGGRSYETAEELLARIRSPHQNPCEEAPEPSRRASRRRRREAAQVGSRRTRY